MNRVNQDQIISSDIDRLYADMDHYLKNPDSRLLQEIRERVKNLEDKGVIDLKNDDKFDELKKYTEKLARHRERGF